MSPTRNPGVFALAAAVALAPAAATAQQAQGTPAPDIAPTDPTVPPEGARSATGVELFDFVEGVAGATGEILEAEAAADRALRAGLVRVGDLEDRAVLGDGGETIGEIERIVRTDGTVWAVIGEGVLGGSELPVEIGRLVVTPDYELRVSGLTEERIEASHDVDLERAEQLSPDTILADLRE